MALELSLNADLLRQKTNVESQLILQIDGIDLIFGAIAVTKFAKYGQDEIEYGDFDLVYGGVIEDPKSRDYISFNGTTTRISQQIAPTKEGATSIQKIKISLIDKSKELSRIFSPGFVVDDLLARRASVYVAFKGGSHPEDSIRILSGIIDNISFGAGNVHLSISHPEYLKRTDLFTQVVTTLTADINNIVTTIPMNTSGLIEPEDDLRSFVRINDEIIEYFNISSPSQLTGVSRGALGTIANNHELEDEITSVYSLSGNPIELALKLMLSGGEKYYATDIAVPMIQQVDPLLNIQNGLFFISDNIERDYGLVVGDFITITGASNGANNFVDRKITNFAYIATGSVVIVDGAPLVDEVDSSAVASFSSKYRLLPVGGGLDPMLVDVARHEFYLNQFTSNFLDVDIQLNNTTNLKDLINAELYFPQGLYPIPRDGKASVNYSLPPLASQETVELNSDNILNPDQLRISRSTGSNFFNSVVWRYEEDRLEEGVFRRGIVYFSPRSTQRIPAPNTPLNINARALRDTGQTEGFVSRQATRFLDRYQFAAETIKFDVNYKTGFKIEVGDIVVFGDEPLQITDINRGDRRFQPRLMEITNKDLSIKDGRVTLEALDTTIGLNGRFAVVSPTSEVDSGATINTVPIKRSFGTSLFQFETYKWEQYIGENITIHNVDYSQSSTCQLVGISSTEPNTLNVSGLSFIPTEGMFIDMPKYDLGEDPLVNAKWKALHAFTGLEIPILAGISSTSFTVPIANQDDFYIGGVVRVHNADFSLDSTPTIDTDDAVITNVVGNQITVNRSLGFTPNSSFVVILIGFRDGGYPYRYI